jgi:hypothetical protein
MYEDTSCTIAQNGFTKGADTSTGSATTAGGLRGFKAFFCLQLFSAPKQNPRPPWWLSRWVELVETWSKPTAATPPRARG